MTSHYARGTAFERQVRHALEADGYDVIRSAGSKGKIDLVAIKRGQILFVQCKLNGLCGPAERSELLRVAYLVDALPLVAYKGTEGRQRPIRYRLLTGAGPKEFRDWAPDEVHEETERCSEVLMRNAAGEPIIHECSCGFDWARMKTSPTWEQLEMDAINTESRDAT